MKEFWMYTAIFFMGSTSMLLLIVFVQMRQMGDEIRIGKQVQRNRRSSNNIQEYQTPETDKKRKWFNFKKRRK